MKKSIPFGPFAILVVFSSCHPDPDLVVIKKLTSIKTAEYNAQTGDFQDIGEQRFIYKNELLVQIDSYDGGIITQTDSFAYDILKRLALRKTRVNPDQNPTYYQNASFDYQGDKTTITLFETNGTWRSPDYVETRIKTTTGLKFSSPDQKTEWFMDNNGNIIRETIGDSSNPQVINFTYDRAPNPQYFPDDIENLIDWDIASMNNVVLIENSDKTLTTQEFQYNSDGYPAVKITRYASGSAFRFEYKYN